MFFLRRRTLQHTHTHTHKRVCMHTHIYLRVRARTHTDVGARWYQTQPNASSCFSTCACTHTYMHAHTHRRRSKMVPNSIRMPRNASQHVHTHTYTHTQTWEQDGTKRSPNASSRCSTCAQAWAGPYQKPNPCARSRHCAKVDRYRIRGRSKLQKIAVCVQTIRIVRVSLTVVCAARIGSL
jgi:hypothetical protein